MCVCACSHVCVCACVCTGAHLCPSVCWEKAGKPDRRGNGCVQGDSEQTEVSEPEVIKEKKPDGNRPREEMSRDGRNERGVPSEASGLRL